MMTPLLLPIRVTACALDTDTLGHTRQVDSEPARREWAWHPPDYSTLAGGGAITPVWPDLFKPSANHPGCRPPPLRAPQHRGVCLSWAPPPGWGRALRQGPDGQDDPSSLPRLPDRWLVVRIARELHDESGALVTRAPLVRAWLVDAGVVGPAPEARGFEGSPQLVVSRGGRRQLLPVGRATDLTSSWKDAPGEERVPLSVRGATETPDHTFAAFAPASLNNLGFIDDLEADRSADLRRLSLSYLVVGWYRDPGAHDPLSVLRAEKWTDPAICAALGLDLPGVDQARQQQEMKGDRCVFHGMVAHLDYFSRDSYQGPIFGSPGSLVRGDCKSTPAEIQIGFGPTPEGALAALLSGVTGLDAAGNSTDFKVDRLLRALLHGWVSRWDALGVADLEEQAELLAAFETVRSGAEWSVAPADPEVTPLHVSGAQQQQQGKQQLTEAERKKREEERRVFEAQKQRLLGDLNQKQAEADGKAREFAAAAENLYGAWWRLALTSVKIERTRLLEFIGSADERRSAGYAGYVRQLKRAHEQLLRERDERKAPVEKLLGEALAKGLLDDSGRLELKEGEAQRYYLRKEPGVALRNVGPRLPDRPLPRLGRTLEQVATRPGADREQPLYAPLQRADVLAVLAPLLGADVGLKPALTALAGEAALVEEAVAALARRPDVTEAAPDGLRVTYEAWQARVQDRLYRRLGGAAIPQRAAAQAPAAQLSLGLLTASGGQVALGDVCTAWTQQPWAPVFLDWQVQWFPPGSKQQEGVSLKGRTLLANRPQNVVARRLKDLDEALAEQGAGALKSDLLACGERLRELLGWDVVAQSLSGLHQQLLERNDALPRVLPATGDPLAELVAGASLGPPDLQGPISARAVDWQGSIAIQGLWVVDRFGQALPLRPRAADLKIRPSEICPDQGTAGRLLLRRRLLEPSRLQVRFEAPDQARPVRGWVVPNLLDRALVLYSGAGAPLGMITDGGSGKAPTWRPALARAPQEPLDDVVGALRGGLLEDATGARFQRLLAVLQQALQRTLPAGSMGRSSAAAALGRPLALVRARLQLDRRGGPLVFGMWHREGKLALSDASSGEDPLAGAVARLRAAQAAVRVTLGCASLPEDGVVAWYREADLGTVQTTIKLSGSEPQAALQLPVPGAGPAAAAYVNLLLDPHGKMYFKSEVTPVTVVSLQAEWYQEQLGRLPAVLRLDPLLIGSAAELRAVLGGTPPVIDLPVAAAGKGRAPGEHPPPTALLSVVSPGVDVRVEPAAAPATVSADVAALGGVLVL